TVGVPLGPTLSASVGLEMPMWVTFNVTGGFTVPVLGSAALEYFIDRGWAATLRVRAGGAVNPSGFRFGGPVVPQLQVAAGLEWKRQCPKAGISSPSEVPSSPRGRAARRRRPRRRARRRRRPPSPPAAPCSRG